MRVARYESGLRYIMYEGDQICCAIRYEGDHICRWSNIRVIRHDVV